LLAVSGAEGGRVNYLTTKALISGLKQHITLFTMNGLKRNISRVFKKGIGASRFFRTFVSFLPVFPCAELTYNLISWRWRLSAEHQITYRGSRFTIAYARNREGRFPAQEFFNALERSDQQKLLALFKMLGDLGRFTNPQKFGDLGNGLFELKSFQIRIPYAYAPSKKGWILLTHGFLKKKDKTPVSEITRARKILQEDADSDKVCLITDSKKRKKT